MHFLAPLSSVTLALAAFGGPLGAQSADPVYAGRSCNQELARLPAVTVSDVVDSATVGKALREAADSTSAITAVMLTYDAYGQLSKINSTGTRSAVAAADLEREVRPAVNPAPGMPNPYRFTAKIVRLNRRDMIDISPSPLTCVPQESSTPEAARLMKTSRRYPSPPPREARVELWLGSDGAVLDAWIVRSAGRSELDSLALNVVRVLRYTPPVFGKTPVATLLQVPVRF